MHEHPVFSASSGDAAPSSRSMRSGAVGLSGDWFEGRCTTMAGVPRSVVLSDR